MAVGFRLGRNTTIVITIKHNITIMHSCRISHNMPYDTMQSRSRQWSCFCLRIKWVVDQSRVILTAKYTRVYVPHRDQLKSSSP